MKNIVFLILLSFSLTFVQAQQSEKLSLKADLNTLTTLLTKVIIERSDLGEYNSVSDTCGISGKQFTYIKIILEPQLLTVYCYWKQKSMSKSSFWVAPGNYTIYFDDNLVPHLKDPESNGINSQIKNLQQTAANFRAKADSLVKTVSYENQEIAVVENRIALIRDSLDYLIDSIVYKVAVKSYPKSPIALYALCKYAERPYTNQRFKSDPNSIAQLLNSLDPLLKNFPSAKILNNKIRLGRSMTIGKKMLDISLPDTSGKKLRISDFKGKWVFVDFWASWCTPCRNQNPQLIAAYNKYKKHGFQVIGISRDKLSEKENWLTAIRADKINIWPQLSDFNNEAQKQFAIRFLPTNYLIDPNGIIRNRDLFDAQIENELKKIFGQ